MMLFESLIFNLLPAAVGIMAVVLVFESCWRKCPPDKLMIVSGAGKMRSVSGKGTFVIPLLLRAIPPPSPTLDTALRSQRGGHPGRYRPRCGLTAQQAAYGHAYSADPMRLPFV